MVPNWIALRTSCRMAVSVGRSPMTASRIKLRTGDAAVVDAGRTAATGVCRRNGAAALRSASARDRMRFAELASTQRKGGAFLAFVVNSNSKKAPTRFAPTAALSPPPKPSCCLHTLRPHGLQGRGG